MGSPSAPPAPEPVDANKSMGEYLFGKGFSSYKGVTDPALQEKLLASESTYRPRYAELNLQDINAYLLGTGGQKGVIDLTGEATRQSAALDREAQMLQREQDINSLTKYGAQTSEALRQADPYSAALAEKQQALASSLYDQAGRVTPEQQRMAEQQARSAGLASGRIGDNSTIAAQLLGRESIMAQRRAEAQQAGQVAFGMNRGLTGDISSVILGRPSQAAAMGSQFFGQAAQLGQGQSGPRLFDPNAGINLALQNASNQGNYNASVYGAKAGAQGAMLGGLFSGLGALGGGALCWVAREVYGEDNPKWIVFRNWLAFEAPDWLFNLYLQEGERFAAYIKDKPAIKWVVRKLMDFCTSGRI